MILNLSHSDDYVIPRDESAFYYYFWLIN